jgi:cholesterol transport system auxiliary component
MRPCPPRPPAHPAARRLAAPSLGALAATVALGGLLAGCGSGAVPATYDLSALPSAGRSLGAGRSVVVAEPVTLQPLEGDRIIVKDAAGGVSFLGGGQWSDRLPRLIQARILQTFENTGRLRSVSRPGDRVTADYTLISEIRAFEVAAGTGEAVVQISAKLVGEASNRVAAARIFEARVPVAAVDAGTAARGLDQALAGVLGQMARWIGTGR